MFYLNIQKFTDLVFALFNADSGPSSYALKFSVMLETR